MIDIQALPVELQEILAQMQDTTPGQLAGLATYLGADFLPLADLDDGKHPALVLYSEVKQLLATSHGHESHQRARNIAESLVRLSEEQIRSYNYRDVPRGWREMLTDATVYWAIATLADDDDETEQSQIAAVGRLDRAIIVAGDTGSVRERVVFTLIKLVQSRLHHAADDDRPKKRRRLAIAQPLEAPYITHAIPRFGNGLSLNEFTSQCIDGPFIISEGCADWPAVERWREVAYLRQIAGRGRVVPVEIGDDYTSDNWGQEIRSLDAVLDSLWSASPNDEPKLYLAQHDLFRQLPDLRRDVIAPDYVYTAPPAPGDAPEYRPPAHEDGYILNAWLGPPGTLSPAHTDPYYNCYGA